jgi:hypothetical protein
MFPLSRKNGKTACRLLAVLAVLSQLLGTIGIIPVSANSDDSSKPYPCKNHPCGCRSAAQCWAGACCCFTMRQKVAWAEEHGISPPVYAVQMAEAEKSQVEKERCSVSHKSCCSGKELETPTCNHESRPTTIHKASSDRNTSTPHKHVGWVPGVFAQKCRGDGFGELGLLNIGIPPSLPVSWILESVCVELCMSPNQIAILLTTRPHLPPPRV